MRYRVWKLSAARVLSESWLSPGSGISSGHYYFDIIVEEKLIFSLNLRWVNISCTVPRVFIKIVHIILRIELCEYSIYVLWSLSTNIRDVETHKFRWHIVIGWHDYLYVFFLIVLSKNKDLLGRLELVES